MELPPSDKGDLSYAALIEAYASSSCHPTLIVASAVSEQGRYIIDNRDGEMEFDGFWHAYCQRGDQLFLVTLAEIK